MEDNFMKHIIIVRGMQCASCKERIEKGLTDAGIKHKVDLANSTVAVDRNGDVVAAAKRVIVSLGYSVI